jgi:hypothetical protein
MTARRLTLFGLLPVAGAAAAMAWFLWSPESAVALVAIPLLTAAAGAAIAPTRWKDGRSRLSTFAAVLLVTSLLLVIALLATVVVAASWNITD